MQAARAPCSTAEAELRRLGVEITGKHVDRHAQPRQGDPARGGRPASDVIVMADQPGGPVGNSWSRTSRGGSRARRPCESTSSSAARDGPSCAASAPDRGGRRDGHDRAEHDRRRTSAAGRSRTASSSSSRSSSTCTASRTRSSCRCRTSTACSTRAPASPASPPGRWARRRPRPTWPPMPDPARLHEGAVQAGPRAPRLQRHGRGQAVALLPAHDPRQRQRARARAGLPAADGHRARVLPRQGGHGKIVLPTTSTRSTSPVTT